MADEAISIPNRPNAVERKTLIKLANSLYKSTHFTREETEKLLLTYRNLATVRLDKQKKTPNRLSGSKDESSYLIDRSHFRDLLHKSFGMTDDFLMDRVFKVFDEDSDSHLDQKEWIKGMSVFLRGNLEEKTKYCFRIYDLNDDGYLLRDELFYILKNSMIKQPTEEDPDEGTRDLVEITLKKLDADGDLRVSLDDYRTTVQKVPLLLEALGQCLPDKKQATVFLDDVFSQEGLR
ncbi:calaxin-like [Dysidea avara]|uniref:calaxin-like n=1 Tax=Dysidea avara TaxID=196820 RepID=UPI00332DF05C